ncbi:MAG: waaF [Paucimonas sp.]|jgi:lipopolysaccharide heptosyltransferase II|nr:waaF [Paucimonas sp.]
MKPGRWEHVRNILCIRLDHLGDVLMTTPAIRALKHSLPGCRITLLASDNGAAGARFMPEIDETIRYASAWMKSGGAADAKADLEMVRILQAKNFDAVVIFTAYGQSPLPAAMLCYLAGIPLRLARCRDNPYHLLTDWVRDSEPQEKTRHEVRRQLDLIASIGCSTRDERLSFRIPDQDAAWARRHLQKIGINLAEPWILLHPGATAASHSYPPAMWAEAVNRLFTKLECPIVFIGGASQAAMINEIRAGLTCPSFSLAGKLELGCVAAVLAQAPVLLCNHSGAAHLAAAVGTPVVSLYAPTHGHHVPWHVAHCVLYHKVPCTPGHKIAGPQGHGDHLEKVLPSQIARATLDLLRETAAQRNVDTAAANVEDQVLQPLVPLPYPKHKHGFEPLTAIVIRQPPSGFQRR